MIGRRKRPASFTAIRNIKSPFQVGPIEPVKAESIEVYESSGARRGIEATWAEGAEGVVLLSAWAKRGEFANDTIHTILNFKVCGDELMIDVAENGAFGIQRKKETG
jgi:hypothetical protein